MRDARVVATQFQQHGERLGCIPIVVDKQDAAGGPGRQRLVKWCCRLRLRCFVIAHPDFGFFALQCDGESNGAAVLGELEGIVEEISVTDPSFPNGTSPRAATLSVRWRT